MSTRWSAAYVGAFVIWKLTGTAGSDGALADLAFLPPIAAAIHAARCASRRSQPDARLARAWGLVALALLTYLVGTIVRTVASGPGPPSYPLAATPFFILIYPLGLWALLLLPTTPRARPERLKLALDCTTVAVTGATAVWFVVAGPMASAGVGPLDLGFSLAYPVGDMVLIAGLASATLRRAGAPWPPFRYLMGALGLFVLADLAYSAGALRLISIGDGQLDVVWMVAIWLFLRAAQSQPRPAPLASRAPAPEPARGSWLPLVGMLAVFGLLLATAPGASRAQSCPLVSAACILAALAVARELVVRSQLRGAHRQLGSVEHTLQTVLEGTPMILFAFNAEGVLTVLEGRALRRLVPDPAALNGASVFELLKRTPELAADCVRALEGESFTTVREVGGRVFDAHYTPLRDAHGSVREVIGVATDVTARRRGEEQIAQLAFHDQLTGLANRRLLERRLDATLFEARENGSSAGILYIDLDHFKLVNDGLGHSAGDEVLREVSHRLRLACRPGDLLARQGGDEFILLLGDLGISGRSLVTSGPPRRLRVATRAT